MITTRSIKIFLVSLSMTFLMSFIPHLNIKQAWITPKSATYDVLEKIKPKLELKQNNFQLQRSIIPPVSAGSSYDEAAAYVVVDFDTGQIIASKNLSSRLPIASLTKVMTAVVALDLADPEERFTVSSNAVSQVPTKVMLKEGEEYRLRILLKYLLITSANDSAEVIKEGIDNKYGREVFITAMNLKAQVLGLKNTRFANAKGLDDVNNFSSAEDLSILSVYVLQQYPLIAEIVAKEYEDLTGGVDFRFYLNNWNGLLGVYPGALGLKTGNTGKAGNCTIVVSERGGKKLIAVVLGAPGVLERDLWASQLLDLAFGKVAGLESVNVTEEQLRQKYASWKYL